MNTQKYVMLFLASAGVSCTAQKGDNIPRDLNVIYILADDLGYGDVGCYGQTKIKTPNIDKLAAQGMMFMQHYSGSPVSAPSRSTLMSGLHTGHSPIRENKEMIGTLGHGQYPLPDETYTLGEMFKESGYKTGTFGKWGLGYPGSEGDPMTQGFDEFFGYKSQSLAHKYYPEYLWHNSERVKLEGNDYIHKVVYSADLIHEKTLEYIRKNKENKFFVYMSYTLPHGEITGPEDNIVKSYRGKFKETPYVAKKGADYGGPGKADSTTSGSQAEPSTFYAAMVTRLDKYTGDVVALVKELGIEDKTIIIFTSDNGPANYTQEFNSSGPFHGRKGTVYEGGIRVPMIAYCPPFIKAGSKTDHISAFWDILPTFAEMTGVKLKNEVDGISILPTLFGLDGQKEHEYLYWEYKHDVGVRMGSWKGIKLGAKENPNGKIELYDLSKDIHEDNNVAEQHPKVVKKIEQIMKDAHIDSEVFPL